MEQVMMEDFTGGTRRAASSRHFEEGEWAKLEGCVLETDGTLRSQWELRQVGAKVGCRQVFYMSGKLYGLFFDDVNGYEIWWLDADQGGGSSAWTWTQITGISLGSSVLLAGVVLEADAENRQGFVPALLVQQSESDGAAYSIRDGSPPTVTAHAERYPDEPGDGGIPYGRRMVNWGDYTVLGNINWLADDALAYDGTNVEGYPNGLWFSQPGRAFQWSSIDVEFMPARSEPKIAEPEYRGIFDMHVISAGMVVLATSGVFLLRGDGTVHEIEQVPTTIAPFSGAWSTLWDHVGAVVWMDKSGALWHTNGSETLRLDTPLRLDRTTPGWGQIASVGPHLLVVKDNQLWCMTAMEDGGAGWTKLVAPDMHQDTLGYAWPGSKAPNLHAAPNGEVYLIDETGQPWRFVTHSDTRGVSDLAGQAQINPTIASRTLEAPEGHNKTLWRNIGIKAFSGDFDTDSTGTLESVTWYQGPALRTATPNSTVAVGEAIDESYSKVVDAGGSSLHGAIELTFAGDVTLESVSVFYEAAREVR